MTRTSLPLIALFLTTSVAQASPRLLPYPSGRPTEAHVEQMGFDEGPFGVERDQYGSQDLRADRDELVFANDRDEELPRASFLEGDEPDF